MWTEHYTVHGPNAERQPTAHAHFASYSPDNRFAYINDLGGDCIHIYKLDMHTAMLTPAGTYHSKPGAGPRTLHFHPNGHTAYSINELVSTVDVLEWNKTDGSLTLVKTHRSAPGGLSRTHARLRHGDLPRTESRSTSPIATTISSIAFPPTRRPAPSRPSAAATAVARSRATSRSTPRNVGCW